MKPPFNNFWFYSTVALVVFFLIKGCGKGDIGFFGCNHRDTISVKHDTVITQSKTDTVYEPEFVGVANTVYVPKILHDTLEIDGEPVTNTVIEHVDTSAILSRYYQKVFYSDTQRLSRGTVIISDSVYTNRIISRRLQTSNTDTTINNTITLSQPKKLILYFNAESLGNLQQPFYGAGIGLGLKGKNDVIFDAKYWLFRGQKPMYSGGVSLPIRLLKHK